MCICVDTDGLIGWSHPASILIQILQVDTHINTNEFENRLQLVFLWDVILDYFCDVNDCDCRLGRIWFCVNGGDLNIWAHVKCLFGTCNVGKSDIDVCRIADSNFEHFFDNVW